MARTGINLLSLPQETIARICSHLWTLNHEFEPVMEKDIQALAVLARTCSHLHGPAIATLWHTLHNLAPLVYTLPSDLCVSTYKSDAERYDLLTTRQPYKRLVRSPKPDDFVQWRKYAALVRAIDPEHPTTTALGYDWFVQSDVWSALREYGITSLLPHVRLIDTYDHYLKQSFLDYVSLFTAALTTARLHFADPSRDLSNHIEALAASSPALEELALCPEPYPCLRGKRIVTHLPRMSSMPILPAFTHLRSFRIEWIFVRSPVLAVLGALPLLRVLHVSLLAADYPGWDPMSAVHGDNRGVPVAFAKLQELKVVVDDFSLATSFIAVVSSQRLQKLAVTQRNAPQDITPSMLSDVFSIVTSHPSSSVLQSLSIAVHRLQPPLVLSETLVPLLLLPSLAELELKGWSSICVDPPTLDAMSRAWPTLRHLNLHHPKQLAAIDWGQQRTFDAVMLQNPERRTRVTLVDLLPLVRLCPLLESVGLAIDLVAGIPLPSADNAHSGWRIPRFRPQESALTALYVGYTELRPDACEDVAFFLSSVFPRLEGLGYQHSYYVGENVVHRGEWRRLSQLLREMRRVREQEHRSAAQDHGRDPALATFKEGMRS